MGKMSVDGYLLQAGSVFHAVAEHKTPFSVHAAFDFKHNHLSTHITPPVNVSGVPSALIAA